MIPFLPNEPFSVTRAKRGSDSETIGVASRAPGRKTGAHSSPDPAD